MANVIYQDVEVKGKVTASGTGTFNQLETKSFGSGANSALLNLHYPVGSIYMSVNNNSPASFIGGSWTRIQDVFPLAAGTSYTAGSTGGSATHTLTVEESPKHKHNIIYTREGTVGGDGYILGGTGYSSQETGDVTESGGGQPFSIMPPYLAVYVWKRTA